MAGTIFAEKRVWHDICTETKKIYMNIIGTILAEEKMARKLQ